MLRSGNISRKSNAARENYISLKKHQPIRGPSNDWVVRKNQHMKKITTLLVTAAALIASPAVAQDGPSGFDGFHVEALAGYDVVQITIDEEVYGEELSDDLGGFAYGVAAGYDFSFGGTLLGVEVEYADSTAGESESFVGTVDGSSVDITASFDTGRDLYAGVRLGGQLSERSLVYVKAGYTNARTKLSLGGTVDTESFLVSQNATFDGLRLGLGSEYAFSDKAFAKIEYRLSMYGDGEVEIDGETADIGEIFEYGDINRHQIVVGLGMRF